MISQLASPSVCVIDDEAQDYGPILSALSRLNIGFVHVLGDDSTKLPASPFTRLQLVFLDLHLSSDLGKGAASHTANVFRRVVFPSSAPVVVVIWSKYAQEVISVADGPANDQETEAELFKRTLFEAHPEYERRLIFVEMAKPKAAGRDEGWAGRLDEEIRSVLSGQPAIELMWRWSALVQDACAAVSAGLTDVAASQDAHPLKEALVSTFRHLAKAQGGGNLSGETASQHVFAVLSGLLAGKVGELGERSASSPSRWLAQEPESGPPGELVAQMNGLLLTTGVSESDAPFIPGTVYEIEDEAAFEEGFGSSVQSLFELVWKHPAGHQGFGAWRAGVRPIVVEISPPCDVAHGKRHTAHLIAGALLPYSKEGEVRKAEFLVKMDSFQLKWPSGDFDEQEVQLVICHRLKATFRADRDLNWARAWFRLRELPTAKIRSLHAGHTSRIGFVALNR